MPAPLDQQHLLSRSSSVSGHPSLSSSESTTFSRRPSSTAIPISQFSGPSTLLNDDRPNSAYTSTATEPLLHSTTNPARAPTPGTKLRKRTWFKIAIWSTPVALLVFVLFHHRPSTRRPSFETVSKLRLQIDSILHPSSAYTCPHPFDGRPTGVFDDSKTLSLFEPIASNHTAFSVAISYSKTTCNSFRVRISRNNPAVCLQNFHKPEELNEDPGTVKWIRALGPDTFQLRVDGAERYVVDEPSRYDPERCEYFFDFPLTNAGAVWLDGIHFYENYDAYNSQPRHEISRLLSPLFSSPLRLSLCPTRCTPFVPPLLGRHPSTFYASENRVSTWPAMPFCSSLSPIPGSYVPSAYPSLLYPPYQLPQTPTRPSAGYHTFVPSSCVYFHDGLRFRDHEPCLEQKNRVLFIGDSHTRGLYDVMKKRLEGSDEMALTSFKVANKKERIGNLHLEFLWDPFLEASFDCDYMSRFTHVVVSTGSHQACYRCPTTTSYVSHMSSIFSSWPRLHATCPNDRDTSTNNQRDGTTTRGGGGGGGQRRAAAAAKFVFVTSPSWYPQAIEKYDCRTSQRLTRWNRLSTDVALENGWSVIDAQNMTRSIAVDTKLIDGVHYIKTDAIDPMVDELIMKLDICR